MTREHGGLIDCFLCVCVFQWTKQLNADITEVDPEIVDIIEHEKNRQWKVRGLRLLGCLLGTWNC